MQYILFLLTLIATCAVLGSSGAPNVIILLADDLGIGDLAAYGNTNQESTAIERMADEGMKFTQWTSGAFICTPSRASLLTGRYAKRSGIFGNDSYVFAPRSIGGLPGSEVTLAEALKQQGYATGMVGKWHLGINEKTKTDGVHLPHNHGFDWVGTNLPLGQSAECDPNTNTAAGMKATCFLYNSSTIVEQPIDVKYLTQKLLDDSLTFIRDNKDGQFFLYFAFPQVHRALFCNENFCGSSWERGVYGDSVNEMAWVVGEILDELVNQNIDKNTLVILTSDHGALSPTCQSKESNGQSNGVFRAGKGTTWEGGFRVPAIAWWPGTITPGSTSDNLVNHMDIFPTAIHLAGGSSYLTDLESSGVQIDGELIPDLAPVSGGNGRNSVFYYCSDRLFAVRYDHYKVHYRTMGPIDIGGGCKPYKGDYTCYGGPDLIEHDPPVVFDLNKAGGEREIGEEDSELQVTKDVVAMVNQLVEDHLATFPSTPATSQIDLGSLAKLAPCCNPRLSTCECNFGDEKKLAAPSP